MFEGIKKIISNQSVKSCISDKLLEQWIYKVVDFSPKSDYKNIQNNLQTNYLHVVFTIILVIKKYVKMNKDTFTNILSLMWTVY